MRSSWEQAPLGDLVEDILDRRGVTPTKLGTEFRSSGHRVVSAKLIKQGRFDLDADEPRFVDTETYLRWMRTPLRADDVIMTSEAPLGELAYLRESVDWVLGQRLFAIRTKKDRLHGRFLYYTLRWGEARADVLSRATGTTVHGIRQAELRRVRVSFPSIVDQRAIAHILGTLDDKIELNRRTNETLEAMARALFKSWFVDFDPVRAKAAGRVPGGMDAECAALFPSEFIDSEMGPVPKGWAAKATSDACELNPLRTLRKGTLAPYVEMASLPTCGHRPSKWPLRETGSGARFQNGDTLLARITPCLENGKTGYVDFLDEGTVGWGSTEYIVIRPRPPLPTEWGYLLARDPAFRDFATQKMEGTTGRQRVSAEAAGRYVVAVAPAGICERFAAQVAPMFHRMAATCSENTSLAAMRDTLLPLLLSGDLPTPTAEHVAGAAT